MLIYLVRHGNTFHENEVPRMIGATENLPLTEYGILQAANAANYFVDIKPEVIVSAELLRTKDTALAIKAKLPNAELLVDNRLNEINYGTWSNLSSAEIKEFAAVEHAAWEQKALMPVNSGWQPQEDALNLNLQNLVSELSNKGYKKVLIVSSNGIIRFFLKLIPGAMEQAIATGSFKVATGSISCLDLDNNDVVFWNIKPSLIASN